MESRTCHYGWRRILFRPLTSAFLCCGLLFGSPVFATSIFINEFHYDNASTDSGEGIEIAGPTGTDLNGWSLVLYNGSSGDVYESLSLSGTLMNQNNGFGALSFAYSGIQNGAPDGFALIDAASQVVQFLSYEGTLTAADGPASGNSSTDVGVAESGSTLADYSLQLTGTGSLYEDFYWTEAKQNTFGIINTGQTFTAQAPIPTPEPGTFVLFGAAAAALLLRKRLTR